MNRLAVLLGCLLPVSAVAASDDGAFAVKGIGQIDCGSFLEHAKEKSNLYWNIGGWVDGYVTGYNAFKPETFDVASFYLGPPSDVLLAMVGRHCQQKPGDRLGFVLNSLLEQLHFIRLQEHSEAVEVDVDGEIYPLYKDSLRRIQESLASQGYYDGALDGVFGPETQSALQSYQRDKGASGSGAPTARTVLQLLVDLERDR